jgi:tRNA (guanine9-N1)-methyltransferase
MEAEERMNHVQELGDSDQAGNGTAQVTEDNIASGDELEVDQSQSGNQGLNRKRKRTPPPEGMSISAFKRLKRQQKWEAGKADRRVKKKEKERSKKEARRAAIASGDMLPSPSVKIARGKLTQVPIAFVIDCGFDELMTENELKSLAGQITRCYSDNSKARFTAHLAVSSFGGRLRERFDTVLGKQYPNWKGVNFYDEDFVDVAGKMKETMADEKSGGKVEGALADFGEDDDDSNSSKGGSVIYLSSESENTIDRLDPYCTYIIGGLVDRNRHKGICYKRACERGTKTAKLPIGEFMEMNSRYVLATNHVSEIMLHWLDVGDWGEAFVKVIPKRKGGTLKEAESKEESLDIEEVDEAEDVRLADEAEGQAEEAVAGSNHDLNDIESRKAS